ncbi:MAG: hypothetical protein HYX57_02820 [Chloroflexi bacterium]|nr:hypothetical protein [Chloroflexota bacterium]
MAGELLLFLGIAAIVGLAGAAFGMVWLSPRLTRLAERSDEEPGGGDD